MGPTTFLSTVPPGMHATSHLENERLPSSSYCLASRLLAKICGKRPVLMRQTNFSSRSAAPAHNSPRSGWRVNLGL